MWKATRCTGPMGCNPWVCAHAHFVFSIFTQQKENESCPTFFRLAKAFTPSSFFSGAKAFTIDPSSLFSTPIDLRTAEFNGPNALLPGILQSAAFKNYSTSKSKTQNTIAKVLETLSHAFCPPLVAHVNFPSERSWEMCVVSKNKLMCVRSVLGYYAGEAYLIELLIPSSSSCTVLIGLLSIGRAIRSNALAFFSGSLPVSKASALGAICKFK